MFRFSREIKEKRFWALYDFCEMAIIPHAVYQVCAIDDIR